MSQNNSELQRALSDTKVQSIVTNAGVSILIYADDLVVLSWRVIPTQRHYNGTRSVESQRCARTSSLQCDSEQWICASSQWGHDLLLEVPCYNHIDFPGDWTIKTLYEDDKEDAKEGAVYDRIGRFFTGWNSAEWWPCRNKSGQNQRLMPMELSHGTATTRRRRID